MASALLIPLLCFNKGSAICFPIRIVGSREVIGSWKIIEISFPRIFCHSSSFKSRRLRPLNNNSPCGITAFFAFKPIKVFVVTDLPEPDSPTIARVCPFSKSKETSRIALTSPA